MIMTTDPLRIDTEFCFEMQVVKEVCGGSMKEWSELPLYVRRAWVYHSILQSSKQSHQVEVMKEERDRQDKLRDSMPKIEVDRGRLR